MTFDGRKLVYSAKSALIILVGVVYIVDLRTAASLKVRV